MCVIIPCFSSWLMLILYSYSLPWAHTYPVPHHTPLLISFTLSLLNQPLPNTFTSLIYTTSYSISSYTSLLPHSCCSFLTFQCPLPLPIPRPCTNPLIPITVLPLPTNPSTRPNPLPIPLSRLLPLRLPVCYLHLIMVYQSAAFVTTSDSYYPSVYWQPSTPVLSSTSASCYYTYLLPNGLSTAACCYYPAHLLKLNLS